MDSLTKLKGTRAALVAELQRNAEGESFSKSLDVKLQDQINTIDAQIKAVEDGRDYAQKMARPAASNGEHEERTHGYKDLGDWLKSVMHAGIHRQVDSRLTKFPSGMGETDPSGGGFAIPPQFFNEIITKTYQQGRIASEVFRLPVSESNGISLPLIDEQSRANGSRWGGVKSQWLSEGTTGSYSAPKFRLLELKLQKLGVFWAVTDELMADAPAVSAVASRAFSEELLFVIEDSIINADGVGKPQGIMNSPAKLAVAKDTSQTAATITYSNLANMYTHMWSGSLPNAKWYASQSVMSSLLQLQLSSGTTLSFPMWVAPGDGDKPPKTMLLGHELVFVEQAQQLGTEGDIMFADLSQYVIAEKSTPQYMSSPHVLFLQDEMAFRLIYRVDGHSMWATTLTPAYGTNTMSPFVTLAVRS